MPVSRGHAVVIGAGIAGLTSARVLADHFERVTVVDRDPLTEQAQPRPNVPQGAHAHVVLASGLRTLEDSFPGLTDELRERGAVTGNYGRDVEMYRGGRWAPAETDMVAMGFTRPLLESVLRRRVVEHGVALAGGTAVTGLLADADRVVGVRTGDDRIAADLVVDASGRAGDRSDKWLAELGFATPEVTTITIGIGYATRLVRRDPDDPDRGKFHVVLPIAPHDRRFATTFPVEDDRWIVSVGGWAGADVPVDAAGVVDYVAGIPGAERIARILASSEPVTDVLRHRFPASRRRHFERLRRLPEGYLATGDALCTFNPVYGQGMTCAAMTAAELDRLLSDGALPAAELAPAFYRAAGRILAHPWTFAAGGDFAFPETRGSKPPGTDLLNRYVDRLQRAAITMPHVRLTLAHIQNLMLPPAALFRPRMVLAAARPGPAPVPAAGRRGRTMHR